MSKLKPGGLAMIVKADNPDNNGKIVTCVKFLPNCRFLTRDGDFVHHDAWQIDTVITTTLGGRQSILEAFKLRPFDDPDDDAVDQMVQLLGKPTTKKEELHV